MSNLPLQSTIGGPSSRITRTALEIDRALVREAMVAMGTRTIADTVHQALRRVVDLHRQMVLFDRLAAVAEQDLAEARRARGQQQAPR
jgi:Arc/MetJ family transcription regulator